MKMKNKARLICQVSAAAALVLAGNAMADEAFSSCLLYTSDAADE